MEKSGASRSVLGPGCSRGFAKTNTVKMKEKRSEPEQTIFQKLVKSSYDGIEVFGDAVPRQR